MQKKPFVYSGGRFSMLDLRMRSWIAISQSFKIKKGANPKRKIRLEQLQLITRLPSCRSKDIKVKDKKSKLRESKSSRKKKKKSNPLILSKSLSKAWNNLWRDKLGQTQILSRKSKKKTMIASNKLSTSLDNSRRWSLRTGMNNATIRGLYSWQLMSTQIQYKRSNSTLAHSLNILRRCPQELWLEINLSCQQSRMSKAWQITYGS